MIGRMFKRKKNEIPVECDNRKDSRLALVYTASGGHEFYSVIDPTHLPAARGVAAERALRFMNMNLSESVLRDLLFKQQEAQNKGDHTTAHAITREMQLRLDFLAEEQSMMELAAVYVYLRGESPDVPSQTWHNRKMQIMRDDPMARAFFLATAQGLSKHFSSRPAEDLLAYLAESQGIAERAIRLILWQSQGDSKNG
jgi:hypothetical protein